MLVSAGTFLGPYEVVSLIGQGGMGEVYKARDKRLGRDVAIKICAEQFSERFEREARAVAALNHPNICTIHDVAPNYIVMELIEGPTLAERIKDGPIPLEEALAIARQIADALDTAHEKGIVHRDLKPGNIKIKPDGTVKVLDFGLAKMDGTPAGKPEDSPTITLAATRAGVILGTAAYMSPEQARGKEVDKRTDIWAFGVVLYEMVVHKRPFAGDTTTDVFASIVKEQPDLSNVPPRVRRLVEKCLEKDEKIRLRDIGDAKHLVDNATPIINVARPIAWICAAAFFFATTVGISVVHFRSVRPDFPVVRSTIIPPAERSLNFDGSLSGPIALSPNVRHLVFGASTKEGKRQIWIRSLDSLAAQLLPGTDGASNVFWSPDSRFLGFFAEGKLKKVDTSGGSPLTICDAPIGMGGTWNRDGVIVFAPNRSGPLYRISASGGTATPVTAMDRGRAETAHRWPWFLPDGRHFLYAAGNAPGDAGSRGSIRVASIDSNGRDSKVLLESEFNAAYTRGYLLFMRESSLMAQPFDLRRLLMTGEASVVADQIRTVSIPQFRAAFSLSEDGLLVYRKDNLAGARELTWFDRKGARISTVGEPAFFADIHISPDGKTASSSIGTSAGNSRGVWLYDVDRGFATRFSTGSAVERAPVWSTDGRTIIFTSNRNGHFDLYQKQSNGSGQSELLYSDELEKYPTSVSPDGNFLLYYTLDNPRGANHVWVLPLRAERKPFAFTDGASNQYEGQFSPDGRWILYASDESGGMEIYVAPFPGPGGKQRVSKAGGWDPRWRRDGKEIFYIARPGGQLISVNVNRAAGAFEVGAARVLFSSIPLAPGYSYDLSPDGERFLVISASEQNASEPLTLVQNWAAGLKK